MKKNNKKNIFILTGGTGGHIIPAYYLAQYLSFKYQIHFVVSSNYYNYKFSRNNGNNINCHIVNSPQFYSHSKLLFLFKLLFIAIPKSFILLIRYRPKLVISFGSYNVFSTLLLSVIFRRKIILHEQNSVISKINNLFLPFSNLLLTFFYKPRFSNQNKIKYKKYNNNIKYVGLPFDKRLYELKERNIYKNYIKILVTAGSGGSSFFDKYVVKEICKIKKINKNIIIYHQSKDKNPKSIYNKYKRYFEEVTVKPFFDNLTKIMNKVDIVIARAGAGTINELSILKKASILIAFDKSVNNHQYYNSKILAKKDMILTLSEKDIIQNKNKLANMINDLAIDNKEREKLSNNISTFHNKGSYNYFNKYIESIMLFP